MLNFDEIYWRNLLGTGQDGVRINLNTYNLTLSHGKNGSGKSTILDAIFYVLFGKPYRKIKLSQLINSINKKDMLVELTFHIGSVNYKVIRGMKPAIFEVYKDGVLQDIDRVGGDYQEKLEKNIIKTNYKSMAQIVVMGSSNFVPFMKLPAPARREIIEDLLNIQIFSTMNALLKTKVTTNKADLTNIDHTINLCQQKIDMHQKYLESLKQNNNIIIDEKKDKIKEHEVSIESYMERRITLNSQLNELNQTISDHQKVLKKEKDLLDCERGIEENIRGLNKEIKFFDNHDNCPTCTQGISQKFKHSTVEGKNTEISTLKDALEKLEEHINKTKTRLNEINKQLEIIGKVQRDINENDMNIRMTQQYIKQLNEEIRVLNVHNKNFEIDETESIKLKKEFDDILVEKKKLTDLREIYNTTSMLLKDGGIKTQIIKQYIPIINQLINKYLGALDFMVSFELNEDFEETILSRGRDNFSFESFSEGEKLRINIAILFAWRAIAKLRNTTNTNLLILDELLDGSLDSQGIEDFLKILKTLTNENVIIVSHKPAEITDHFDRVLEFQKIKSFSKMIEV